MTFEIVFGAEQALPAGLALSLGDGAQRVEAPRDGREEALFGFHIGRNGPEQRRLCLIGAVGAAQSLDGRIGLPSSFQEIMDSEPSVPCREVRVIGTPGTAGVGEDEDAFRVIHERLGLAKVGGAGAVLDDQSIDSVRSGLADDPARTSSDFRHHVGAKALHDLVERTMNRRQRRQFLDQPVAPRDGVPGLYGLAVAIDRTRRQVAFAVGKRLVELGREAVRQIIQHIFARRDVDLDVAPFLGRDFGKAAFHQRLAGRDDLDHGGMAVPEIALDGGDQRRRLHRRDEMIKEALFCRFERGPGRGFCLRVERAGLRP